MPNGADSTGLDDLPEPVRLFAKEHQSWSVGALLMKWRACNSEPQTFLSEMNTLEATRRKAYYKEMGFQCDPATGQPFKEE